jgi:hypothetical protein
MGQVHSVDGDDLDTILEEKVWEDSLEEQHEKG